MGAYTEHNWRWKTRTVATSSPRKWGSAKARNGSYEVTDRRVCTRCGAVELRWRRVREYLTGEGAAVSTTVAPVCTPGVRRSA